jgi:hypothetical protein
VLIFTEHLKLDDNSLIKWALDNSAGDHSNVGISLNENTGITLTSDKHMDNISTLSIGLGPQAPMNLGPYPGGGTAPSEPDFLPDSTVME